ncbi:hypothetical protein HMN09_01179600 [Mycena chlorophos]|uniref:Uncharacterized protein n=1 Tax=Mycena chlorophos TaxID=658473 RepID=A0A8H6VTY5_MYCCL|nr:hypothetical protein HMN09_01179600 [Mycena chlorophos]
MPQIQRRGRDTGGAAGGSQTAYAPLEAEAAELAAEQASEMGMQNSLPGPSTPVPQDDPPPPMDTDAEPPPHREPTPVPEPAPEPTGRPVRTKRPTWKLLQQLPDPPAPLPDAPEDEEPEPELLPEPEWNIRTDTNAFGLYREYPSLPTHNPDSDVVLSDLSDIPAPQQPNRPAAGETRLSPLVAPVEALAEAAQSDAYGIFGNYTVWGFMNWMWTGSATKSIGEGLKLLEYLKNPLFKLADLMDFDLKAQTQRFDQFLRGETSEVKDGWQTGSVTIDVPDHRRRKDDEPLLQYSIPDLHFRDLTETITATLSDATARVFHFTPFRQFWQPRDGGPAQRVHDEIFSSEAYIEEYIKLQRQPPEPGCTLERGIVALMFWSDATHLANFGTASLWPVYLFFGNLSKWVRGKPRARACHHVAYMPKVRHLVSGKNSADPSQLPDDFFDWFKAQTGDAPPSEVLTHCRRELLHAIWRLLLNDKFMEACKHGIVVVCPDGVSRRFYFRLFTYSADYPEKVLLAAIRGLGRCQCPRCTTPTELFHELGTIRDANRRVKNARHPTHKYLSMVSRARYFIYRAKAAVKGKPVERLMQPESWVPTENAFLKIEPFTWDIYRMLAPDLMHEFELGVWKGTFVHLLRILHAHGGDPITILNQRYRLMPTFARDTIRRFTNNTSAMKKLAAHDYEDILQASAGGHCALPAFENLLDSKDYAEDNEIVQDLIFAHAYWHGLAKLRMHTSETLKLLNGATRDLGYQLRRFARTTCTRFVTKELPREEAARRKRYARKVQDANRTGAAAPPEPAPTKIKKFNGNTVKTHFLGDYVPTIPLIGTSDSWSTATGELEHKRGKAFYSRTSKNNATEQIGKLERREAALSKIADRVRAEQAPTVEPPPPTTGSKRKRQSTRPAKKQQPTLSFAQREALPFTPPDAHFHMSLSRNVHVNLDVWITQNLGDPAFNNIRVKLLNHLLGRYYHPEYSSNGSEYTSADRARVVICNNDRLQIHKVLRVNYTDYCGRRGQDSMNSRTHADVMTLADEDSTDGHPFRYFRIIGVWHCDVQVREFGHLSAVRTVPLLFARAFRLDRTWKGGFKRRRLHRIEFLPESDPDAYVFVHPEEVIREAHLVPAYAHGATMPVHYETIGRKPKTYNDWNYHYVNFFVDRDMLMRYVGGGVGHSYRVLVPDPPPEPTELLPFEIFEDEPDAPPRYAAHAVPDALEEMPTTAVPGTTVLEDPDSSDDNDGVPDAEDGEDSGSELDDSEEEDGDEDDEDDEFDFGPEDGEDGLDDSLRDLASGTID